MLSDTKQAILSQPMLFNTCLIALKYNLTVNVDGDVCNYTLIHSLLTHMDLQIFHKCNRSTIALPSPICIITTHLSSLQVLTAGVQIASNHVQ